MSWSARAAGRLLLAASLSIGCGARLQLSPSLAMGGGPVRSFWPPPEPTSLWSHSTAQTGDLSLGEAADRVATALRSAGYDDLGWYAIGTRYAHGFAVTTRLEKIRDDASPAPLQVRWSEQFPAATNLLWIERAPAPKLPGPGRYRVFLVAFTDLPIGPTSQADHHDGDTWMVDRPRGPSQGAFGRLRLSQAYRLAAYVYEYQSSAPDGAGERIPVAMVPAIAQIEKAGLSALE